jgi:hypothetical protein
MTPRGLRMIAAVTLAAALAVAAEGQRAGAQSAAPIVDLGGGTVSRATPDAVPGLAGMRRDGTGTETRARPEILLAPAVPGRSDRTPRLVGERAMLDLVLDLPPGATAALRLMWRSTVNILPERSAWTIRVNDGPALPLPPPPVDGFAPVTVPDASLVPGRNRLRLEAIQHHRIFCGPQATFDVWTEFDLSASGVPWRPEAIAATPDGFAAALAAQAARDGRIVVRGAEGVDPAALRMVAARVAAATGLGPDAVLIGPPAFDAPAMPDLARITVLPGPAPAAEITRGGDGAVVLIVVTAPGAALPDLADLLPQAAAGSIGAVVDALPPGRPTALADLGLNEADAWNRYATFDVRFRLPDDWLLLASQNARLDLLYGFDSGLPRGALLLVKVNGTTVRLLPLDRGAGGMQPVLDVGFKARLLRPGVNVLRFEGIVPGDPPDLPCVQRQAPLWTVATASRLTVPPSPRMDFPAIAPALRMIGGDAVEAVPNVASPVIGEAALVPFRLLPPGSGGRLTVAALADAGALQLDAMGLDRRAVEAVLSARAPAPAASDGGAPPLPEAPPLIDVGFLADWARAIWQGIVDTAVPGDPSLDRWLAGRHGQALLVLPDPERRGDLLLILGPGAEPGEIARRLAALRESEEAPQGRVALLEESGAWASWQPASTPPRLREPLRWGNLRDVLGNYASWSPILFVGTLLALATASAVVAMLFAVRTRGRRKR